MADVPQKTITLAPGALWSDQIAAELDAIASDVAPIAWWREQIERGRWHLLHAAVDGQRVGCIVYRIDHQPSGHELVIVGANGSDPSGAPLLPRVMPLLHAMAAGMGCVTARVHTRRMGMVKALERDGYERAEWVMRRWL